MKVIQIVPSLSYGDAVGNDVLALDQLLRKLGIDTVIFTEGIGKRIPEGCAKYLSEWKQPDKNDVIIYHMAIAFDRISVIIRARCRKIAIYHNITPPEFYKDYDMTAYKLCEKGLNQVKSLNRTFDYCLADSEFNKQDLISYGYTCPIDVLPILIPYEDYRMKPNPSVIRRYKGKATNILFVGRVVPNKKQEDLLAVFSLYKKHYDPDAKLFLIGSFSYTDRYCRRLMSYIDRLGLVDDVIIPGHIGFDEILAYYASADVFLCLSEHEGFCVPLIEAMLFKVPIIAYDSCAVGETLGEGGILLKERNSVSEPRMREVTETAPEVDSERIEPDRNQCFIEGKNFLDIAGMLYRVSHDEVLREQIIENQKERMKHFRTARVESLFKKYLKAFLKGDKKESR